MKPASLGASLAVVHHRGAEARPGRRRPWVLPIARRYARWRLGRAFDGLFVAGLPTIRTLAATSPVVIAANHVAWWDPFLALMVDQHLETEGYAVMDAGNLARLSFFAALGAVPLDRSSPRRALADLRTHARLLDAPRRALWIFPQGHQRPAHLRPLGLHAGVHVLSRASGAPVIPVSISYTFREGPAPSAIVSLGEAIHARDRAELMAELERSLVHGLDCNDAFAVNGTGSYRSVIAPRATDGVPALGRAIARLMRGGRDA